MSGPRTPLRVVGDFIDNAAELPPPLVEEDGGAPENPRPGGSPGLPPGCPVTPLGLDDDGQFYYLDAVHQLRVMRDKDHGRLGLLGLFNRQKEILLDTWPRMDKGGNVTGWRPERAAEELIAACGRKGPLNIATKVRGPGAWAASDGTLILHCGNRVLHAGIWRRPGEADGFVYPSAPAVPPPAEVLALGGQRGPAMELLRILQTWQWARPETDPHLLLGWIGAAKVGGALPWRPTLWITGDSSTGKSTLLGLLTLLFGAAGAHVVTDATPAGIWQTLRHASLPVLLDEAEADSDPRRMTAIIRLARAASSGGVTYRGGTEHHPVTFTIRCCFLFSSILIPGLTPQDWSRITSLHLEPLTSHRPPAMSPPRMRGLGEALTRRLVDNWHRLTPVFEAFRGALAAAGHKSRGADQYGALLACADLLLHDTESVPTDELQMWAERLRPAETAGFSDERRDHQRCIDRIMSAIVDPYRGGTRRTIAQWIGDAMAAAADQPETANAILETYGLRVECEDNPAGRTWFLNVANSHAGLAELFRGTHWAPSSNTSAPWVQTLRRFPGAAALGFRRFAGYGARATQLPLGAILAAPEDAADAS